MMGGRRAGVNVGPAVMTRTMCPSRRHPEPSPALISGMRVGGLSCTSDLLLPLRRWAAAGRHSPGKFGCVDPQPVPQDDRLDRAEQLRPPLEFVDVDGARLAREILYACLIHSAANFREVEVSRLDICAMILQG